MNASVKKILLAIVALLAALALGGYFFFIPGQEKKYEREIAAFIDSLPGKLAADAIKVNFLGNSAEIRGLRGTTRYPGSEVTVNVGSLTLKGFNFRLGTAGVSKLADSLIITDCSITQGVTQDIALGRLELHNMRGDLNAAAELFGDTPLERKMEIATSFSAGPVRLRDCAITTHTVLGPVIMRLDSSETQEASLLTSKNSVSEKLTLTAFNTEVMSLDRIHLASVTIPNIIAPVLDLVDMRRDLDDISMVILERIRQKPFAMRGLIMEGFRFQFMMPEPISFGRFSMDLDASADSLAVKKDMQGLILPPSIYGPISMEAAQFSAFYAKPLNLDLRSDFTLTQTGDASAEFTVRDVLIRDKNLASAQASANFILNAEARHVYEFLDNEPDVFLKQITLTLEDKALVSTFLESELATFTGARQISADELREQIAQSIIMLSAIGGESYMLIAEGLASLIQAPGKLTIAGAAGTPVDIFASSLSDTLMELELAVEFTPSEENK